MLCAVCQCLWYVTPLTFKLLRAVNVLYVSNTINFSLLSALLSVSTDIFEKRSSGLRSLLRGEVEEDVCQPHSDAAAVLVGTAGAKNLSALCRQVQ